MRRWVPGELPSRIVVVVALVAALASCSPNTPLGDAGPTAVSDTITPATATAHAQGQAAAPNDEAAASVATRPTTTTTTTPAPERRLSLAVVPEEAAVTLVAAGDTARTVETPFEDDLRGPITVQAEADGYNPVEETVELSTDTDLTIYLDRRGQLLHKISMWDTSGAPKQVAFTPDGSEVWVTLLSGTGFEVFEPMSGERLAAVDLPEAGSVEVIFDRAGRRAYISQMETASVYEIDVATRQILRTLPTEGVWTKVMALSPDERTLWASNWVSNDVSEIDLVSGDVRRRIPTVATPRGLYVTPDADRLYVAGYEHGEIQVLDLATGEGEVIYRSGGAMRHLVGDDERGLVFASDMARDEILVVDTTTDSVTSLATVDRLPNTIDLDPDGRVVYVSNRGRNNPETYYLPGPEWGTVVLVDVATGEPLDAIVAGNQTTGLDVSGDGTMLAFSDFLDNRVSVYRIPAYATLAAGQGGRWADHHAELVK